MIDHKRTAELKELLKPLRENDTEEMLLWDVIRLQKIGDHLHEVFERQCNGHQTPNGDWDEDAAQDDERREARLVTLADRIIGRYSGVSFEVNGDPRGPALKLRITDPDGVQREHPVY